MSRSRAIADMYPLTPAQEGMLFHTLLVPDSGVYVQQVSASVRGAVDATVFERVWQALVDRHPVLRTSFVSDGRRPPFQVVHRAARVPWTYEDWCGVPAAAQQARLAEWLREDRRRGFAVDRPPLMRVALLRLADDRSQVVWTHHHLLLDGWSVPLVLAELVALYDAFAAGTVPSLPAPRPFRDFVAWQRARADGGESERFWREQLHGVAGPTPLPASALSSGTLSGTSPGTPSPATLAGDAPAMASAVKRLSAGQTAVLQQAARERRLTLNTLAVGAWAIVSSRYSGDDDVIFGSTVSGRPPDLPGADAMIGLFINTLPVRVSVPPGADVVEWLGALQARFAAMRRFEHTALTSIHGWSGLPRDTGLFESLVVFENYPLAAAQSARSTRLAIEHADSHERTNYPLTIVVVPGAELLLKADYDTRRLDGAAVDRLLAHYARALTGLADPASRRIADVPWLEDDERQRVLREWNRTDAPLGAFAHVRFAEQARSTPHAIAIRDVGGSVTFSELAARVDRCAGRLRARGVQPEVRVAIVLPPSADAIVAMLAVLGAGGAYVPVDPSYPTTRKRFVVEDSGARFVVTDAAEDADADWLPSSVVRLRVADTSGTGLDEPGPDETGFRPDGELTADNLAYIIYTSGSTGQPKGAMITHGGLANYLEWAVAAYDVAAGSGSPVHTPLGFDLTVTSVFPPLLSGTCLDIVAAGEGVEGLAARLASGPDYSLVKLTPAHVEVLGQLLAPTDAAGATRALVIGGEALLEEPLAFWRAHAPRTRLINEYGPTETVVGCCVHDASREAPQCAAVPIGRPIANTRLYVLDRAACPVPIGVAGELFIGGAGVARGYHGRPDLTAERFVPDPFADEPGARLYRTGDRCKYREDGVLEFLGRLDEQLKIRGFRIEPAEIEAVLRRHPGVAACAVVAQPSGAAPSGAASGAGLSGGARLVAFVVEADPGSVTEAVTDPTGMPWGAFLARELPAHMIPAVFERVPELPLTAHGKVDRRALAERPLAARHVHRSSAPQGAAEELVAAIWADVLGRPEIGRDEKFFDLGGHSLLATRIVARTRAAFGTEIPLRAIFDAPTVAAFTAHIEHRRDDGAATPELPIVMRAQREHAPLSFAQQRLWFIHQLDPENAAYNIRYAVRLAGSLDAAALQRSLDAVAQRHEVLRARFESIDGKPHQIIEAVATIPLGRHDLTATEPLAREETVRRLADEDAARPFDLERGPLVRALLLDLGERDAILVVSMHHIVSDAWSVEILVRELTESYAASTAGRTPSLPDLPVQYADYAAWQRAVLDDAACGRHLAYWTQQLEDVAVLDLPTDRPRPEVPTLQGAALSFAIPAEVTTRVDALCGAESVTPFMILLAVFQILLGRHAGQDDVAVGTPIANRGRPEIDGLIGFFTNSLVLRTRLQGSVTFRDLLARVREITLAAFAHQELPFEMVVDRLVQKRDLARNPLFQVMFTTATSTPVPAAIGDVQLTTVPLDTATAKFDLSLSIGRAADGQLGTFEYSTELFDPDTIHRLAEQFVVLLQHAVGNPDQVIDALPMMSTVAREHVLAVASRAHVDLGPLAAVVDLFERQIVEAPGASAVDLDHTTAYVLDRRFEPVPVGVVGELYLAGAAIGRGSLEQAAATAERFVPDPFGLPGARLYRSGERVRRRSGGELERVDRRSRSKSVDDKVAIQPFLAPRTANEAALASICAEVVGRAEVGVRDNFFEIGGDSILSLQVVSRARARGLYLSAADLFRYQTIEALAAVVGSIASAPLHQRTGQDVPLTPIQQWFFALDLPAAHHWNQALMLEAASGVYVDALEQALAMVMARHDAFTLGFTRTPDGWRQRAMTLEPRVAVQRIDLATVPAARRDEATIAAANRVQASLALDSPPLMRAAVFDFGPIEPPSVLLVLHHLIVDAVSWRILLEDLRRVYPALVGGERPPDAPAPPASFAAWAFELASYADSPSLRHEREYWLDPGRGVVKRLPTDRAIASGENDERSASWIERTLDRAATETLLQRVPSAYNTRTLDVLLTALVETLSSWTGERRALIDLEGHGREEIAHGVDVSGTIGWFTSLFPLWLDLDGVGSGGPALKHVKEVLRAVPQHGLGYGALRYMSSDDAVREALRSGPSAEISFNYLGQVATREDAGWRAIPDRCGSLRGDGPRPHLIEVIATVIDSRLVVRWIHGPAHASETMRSIADRFLRELARLIDHCVSGEAGGYTPSDFAAAAVSQRDLDKLVARLRQ